MSFDWGEYLRLAKDLVKKTCEAELRSAISRAYYSVFITARNLLSARNIPITRSGKDHRLVPETLKARGGMSGNRKAIEAGTNLERLRDDRGTADYENNFPNLNKQTRLDLKIAEKTYNRLLELEEESF